MSLRRSTQTANLLKIGLRDEFFPFLPLHPLIPGRTDAPIKNLEKANSYQSLNLTRKICVSFN